jgi:hypothetical protein
MPGFLLQVGATVMCSHGGQATATVPNPRVTLSGMPSCQLPNPWVVAGCVGIPPSVPPCVTAQWVIGTTRVTSSGRNAFARAIQPGRLRSHRNAADYCRHPNPRISHVRNL